MSKLKDIRDEYIKCRKKYADEIGKLLKANDEFTLYGESYENPLTKENYSHGNPNYTSHHQISKFDLSIHIWINFKDKDGNKFQISLNPLEKDHTTKSSHRLFDRIGFWGKNRTDEKVTEITDINLYDDDYSAEKVIEKFSEFRKTILANS